jgi:hypothetical protein
LFSFFISNQLFLSLSRLKAEFYIYESVAFGLLEVLVLRIGDSISRVRMPEIYLFGLNFSKSVIVY